MFNKLLSAIVIALFVNVAAAKEIPPGELCVASLLASVISRLLTRFFFQAELLVAQSEFVICPCIEQLGSVIPDVDISAMVQLRELRLEIPGSDTVGDTARSVTWGQLTRLSLTTRDYDFLAIDLEAAVEVIKAYPQLIDLALHIHGSAPGCSADPVLLPQLRSLHIVQTYIKKPRFVNPLLRFITSSSLIDLEFHLDGIPTVETTPAVITFIRQ
ncbi:hypothetical protein DXG01_005971 [Tephrocybe rancida]|nr:hypothetical protein DXG01_005971 [Tephrocybe rancida]